MQMFRVVSCGAPRNICMQTRALGQLLHGKMRTAQSCETLVDTQHYPEKYDFFCYDFFQLENDLFIYLFFKPLRKM